ncbi:hypothetical protein HHO41_02490 [Bacillus sp. DNRA2]|uniref:UDP-N-acetylmuramoyl-tripeptide--D-alanyl-D- alanine ligase n=1 Tax=Bacillus sp. DNRA2 TaxID=2723053 RepID=UPI00145E7924|nr:Mur ligase family protein [Bacillus sp. DNRA2]NMD69142.1 hypothetical protein [Bacillus sp. DNRA2]
MEGFGKWELQEILEGEYYNELEDDFVINDFEIDPIHFRSKESAGNGFISISNSRWNEANKKTTKWTSGNEKILNFHQHCKLIITEEPIEVLKDEVTQLLVKDSFAVIKKLAEAAREKMKHPVIGITGSVGKSSTRLMLEHLLREKTVVATRGNHNTQVGVPLYGAKLSSNPDFGILEISLNALNNRGNQAKVIKPDIAVITSIGEAHLSTLHSKENIAKFKARIFEGLTERGIAIINHDIDEFDILYKMALERTNNIKTYSLTNPLADMYLKEITIEKYSTNINFRYRGNDYNFDLSMPSNGMIQNALCAFLCIAEMGFDLEKNLIKMNDFKSFDRVMELKQLKTKDLRDIDVLDDTHNAAIPSMINAIETFAAKAPFYKGTKILVLGQVQDLGEKSQDLHDALIPKILSAGADYVFGHGHYMRNVIKQLPTEMVGGWFDNAKDLAKRIPLYCSNESLVLLKGSVSGSDFRKTSYYLPGQIAISNQKLLNFDSASIAKVLQPIWGAIGYDLSRNEVVFYKGNSGTTAIEGMGPVVMLNLLLIKQVPDHDLIRLNKWPTNRGVSIKKKPFKTGEIFASGELIKELIETQHPSATYELAHRYFGSRNAALQEIRTFSEQIGLSSSSVYNLTGRYRVKEQQSFNLEDLVKIGKVIAKNEPLIKKLPNQVIGSLKLRVLMFGSERKAAICFIDNFMVCLSGLNSQTQFLELMKSILVQPQLTYR